MSERHDSKLSADELNALRLVDCERYLIEWTHRIHEIPAVSDDPDSLLEYLCDCFESQSQSDYFQSQKAKKVRLTTDGFVAGHLSLADWTANTRTILTGVLHERQKQSKQDPEVKAAILHLYSHLLKDKDQGPGGGD